MTVKRETETRIFQVGYNEEEVYEKGRCYLQEIDKKTGALLISSSLFLEDTSQKGLEAYMDKFMKDHLVRKAKETIDALKDLKEHICKGKPEFCIECGFVYGYCGCPLIGATYKLENFLKEEEVE